jgi:uncharacterized DUF497 family protein
MVIVFDALFNNISVISWRSVLLVEETGLHTMDLFFIYTLFRLVTVLLKLLTSYQKPNNSYVCSIPDTYIKCGVMVIVFDALFNNISVISWRSVLLVEETGLHTENHRPAASH